MISIKKTQKLKVLIVDDVEVNRVTVAEAIKEKYEPLMLESGAEALDALKKNNDVVAVITDIMMPEMISARRSGAGYASIAKEVGMTKNAVAAFSALSRK